MSKRTSAASNSAAVAPPLGKEDDNPLKWQLARQRDVTWRKKDLHEVIYWLRQILSLLIGVTWGVLGITGFGGCLLALAVQSCALWVYYTQFLGGQ